MGSDPQFQQLCIPACHTYMVGCMILGIRGQVQNWSLSACHFVWSLKSWSWSTYTSKFKALEATEHMALHMMGEGSQLRLLAWDFELSEQGKPTSTPISSRRQLSLPAWHLQTPGATLASCETLGCPSPHVDNELIVGMGRGHATCSF